jgi:hypothetical protein
VLPPGPSNSLTPAPSATLPPSINDTILLILVITEQVQRPSRLSKRLQDKPTERQSKEVAPNAFAYHLSTALRKTEATCAHDAASFTVLGFAAEVCRSG